MSDSHCHLTPEEIEFCFNYHSGKLPKTKYGGIRYDEILVRAQECQDCKKLIEKEEKEIQEKILQILKERVEEIRKLSEICMDAQLLAFKYYGNFDRILKEEKEFFEKHRKECICGCMIDLIENKFKQEKEMKKFSRNVSQMSQSSRECELVIKDLVSELKKRLETDAVVFHVYNQKDESDHMVIAEGLIFLPLYLKEHGLHLISNLEDFLSVLAKKEYHFSADISKDQFLQSIFHEKEKVKSCCVFANIIDEEISFIVIIVYRDFKPFLTPEEKIIINICKIFLAGLGSRFIKPSIGI